MSNPITQDTSDGYHTFADNDMVMVSRKDIEHVTLSMVHCFYDAELPILNRLRAALGLPERKEEPRWMSLPR